MPDQIFIQGAKEHNLKNLTLSIPKNKYIVFTGLSGSGKSSLAFDTIYAEGQRRYVESLSAYARQFLEQLQKPDVEHIEGLSPAIAIEQRHGSGSPRSIVATQTEVYDYLRLLFARIGKVHCHQCGKEVKAQSSQEIVNAVMEFSEGTKLQVLAPVVKGKKGTFEELFDRLRKDGFVRVRVDKEVFNLEEEIKLDRYKIHNIDVIVDRIKIDAESKSRVASAVEAAIHTGEGEIVIIKDEQEMRYTTKFWCADCGIGLSELEPRNFSFNTPFGACEHCNGLGTKPEFDVHRLIPDENASLEDGAIEVWKKGPHGYTMYYRSILREVADACDVSMDTPWKDIPKDMQNVILHGSDDVQVGWANKPYEGLLPHLTRVMEETDSDAFKEVIAQYMSKKPCPVCKGARLKKESLSVFVHGKSIADVVRMSIKDAYAFFTSVKLTEHEEHIVHAVMREIKKRLEFCVRVGVDYLNLDRLSNTLSGGEAQRIRLATQLGSALSGVIYVLDEPTIGLHQRDNERLINTFKGMRDLGNTVLVVEHDEQVIAESDWLIDIGPGAGVHGGQIVYNGPTQDLMSTDTLTAQYLTCRRSVPIPKQRRASAKAKRLTIIGAKENNLKNVTVDIPLASFVCVTGVSGSGKSTLVEDILFKGLNARMNNSREEAGKHKDIKGIEHIDRIIMVDQSPIGRTPRSNPATYTDVYGAIRDLFASLPEAKARGYKPGRFSFNVKGGRCEACEGDGVKKIDMHFLPSVYVTCDVCKGHRFNDETLQVFYKGHSISDVLNMTVEDALALFKNIPAIEKTMQTLVDVGLGYITLGQSANTLSGGEAQRIKLSKFLRKNATGNTLYILDEPTTGLHFEDVRRLLEIFQRLVDKGNTVLVIEHNLDVIKCCDHIIDMGPEGGEGGGKVVAQGTPEEVAKVKGSFTGHFLKEKLRA
jgi:excinuclease ABC subunit A